MSEIVIQRRLTVAFIDTQPVMIDLIPRERVKQPTGGVVYEDQPPRATQKMRLIEPATPAPVLRASDGSEHEVEFILLGEWDAKIGLWDVFWHVERRWEVAQLYHFNGWEQRASVIRHG